MPTDDEAASALAGRRILRMALGVALGMWIAETLGGPMAFVAPVFAFVFLAAPLPRPSVRTAVGFVLALALTSLAGVVLLPFLEHARWVGIGLFTVALFHTFYFTAKGGSAVLGMLLTLGLTLVAAIGSISGTALIGLIGVLAVRAAWGMVFVLLAHALIPDPPAGPEASPARSAKPAPPDRTVARLRAMRSMLVVLPIALVFFFSGASASYLIVMIKVASMGQQANLDDTREAGRSMLASTIVGGLCAVVAWQALRIWPSLPIYVLLLALFGLLLGRRVFQGAGMHPRGAMWSYAYLTMIILVGPAVGDASGDGAAAAFYSRLFMFLVVAVYGSVAVAVFDAFRNGDVFRMAVSGTGIASSAAE